jgi:PAS domain S-box-containing protein
MIVRTVPELQAVAEDSLPRPRAFQRADVQLSAGMSDLLGRMGATALAAFPMFCNGVPLGVVLMGARSSDALYDRAWQTLEMAANQIAAHVQNALLYSTTQHSLDQRLEQLSLIEAIARQISSALDFDAIVRAVLEAALRATQADEASLALLTEADDLWTILQYESQGEIRRAYRSRGREDGILGQVVATREALLMADTRQTEQIVLPGSTAYLSALAVPLVREHAVIGVLLVESTEVDFFTEEQAGFLKNLAGHAVISIENARLLEERQYQINTLRALQSMALQLSSEIDTTSVARVVLETARELFDAHEVALFRYEEAGGQLTALLALRNQKFSRWASVDFLTSSAALQAAQTDEIQVTRQALRNDIGEEMEGRHEPFTLISVPIKRGGEVHEVLSLAFIEQRSLQKRDLSTVTLLASQAGGHLENAVLHARIRVGSERMRAILNTTRDGVLLLDRDGRLVECNPAAERLLGIDREEFIGRHFVSMLMGTRHADDLDGIGYSRAQLTELARQLRLEPERISRRQFSRVSGGQTIHVEEIGSPVVDADNKIVARLLVLRDITEQKVLNDYRDDITHMAVHDLRGPLAAIISGLSIVMEDLSAADIDPADNEILRVSLDSANTLLELVESMLDIARMESRQMPVNRAPVPVRELIENAMSMLQNSAQLADVKLKVLVEDDLAPLDVDPHLIRRVLVNLIDNALRHTPDGSAVHITARMSEQPGRIVMAVADSGPGIPPTERDHIFERFRQIRNRVPVRGGKGNGLGLTFCRLAIEAHGGRIWVEMNSPLPGACFAFTLPAANSTAANASARA